MEIRNETQLGRVADQVSAVTAVVRPILQATLYSLRKEVVAPLGGYEKVPLYMLADLRKPGDGDCGISFEYAIHDAMLRCDDDIVERVHDALAMCKVKGDTVASIMFGVEKLGSQMLIDTAAEVLTPDSRLMSGYRGQPVKLTRHLASVATAFRSPKARERLPQSISGLWKADLFLGETDGDRWVGTTVKIQPKDLVGARGLRIGIVPTSQGKSDGIRLDEARNLVVCPVPYDQSFMEVFYEAWQTVTAFLASSAKLPKEAVLPQPHLREVAKMLAARREFSTVDVIEALNVFAQPHLLEGSEEVAELSGLKSTGAVTSAFIAPRPLGS
ncbi:hypothetical protein ACFT30_12460 [Microbacterium ureisolvens]|uniref:hypothetical protein n=1 Tax=Microbacterium ureisolvens TaxID=2781186 RepID=UPI0036431792